MVAMKPRHALFAALLLLAGCDDPLEWTAPVETPTRWLAVSAGQEHTCAVGIDGSAWCWGRTATNRLGYRSRVGPCDGERCLAPVPVVGDLDFESISASDKHSCGISRDTAFCWGWDWWGQLGDVQTVYQRCYEPGGNSPIPCSLEPVPVALGFAMLQVEASIDYSCGLTEAGRAFCWGIGQHGQLGIGIVKDSVLSPTAVVGGHVFRSITTGNSHACGLDTAGEAWCWGSNLYGRLGSGDGIDSPVPVQVSDDPEAGIQLTWSAVDAGTIHTCGITTDGVGYCWGGGVGRIGDASDRSADYPRQLFFVDEIEPLVRISAGRDHSCAVSSLGRLFCWGDNAWGQLGDGSGMPQWVPRQIAPYIEWLDVSAGHTHTCALDTSRQLYCWGAGGWGQLGNGSASDRPMPTLIGL